MVSRRQKFKSLVVISSVSMFAQLGFADAGFLLPSDSKIPEIVQKASKSVLRVESPIGVFDMGDAVGLLQLARFEQYIDATINGPTLTNYKNQIKACRKKTRGSCAIVASSSGFMSKDSTTFFTAKHVIQNQIMEKLKELEIEPVGLSDEAFETIKSFNLSLAIKDQNGQTVFGNLPGDSVKISEIDGGFMKKRIISKEKVIMDWVELKLSRPVKNIKPLVFLKRKLVSEGAMVYLAGFPSETTGRSILGAKDFDGKSLLISMGQKISSEAFYQIQSAPAEWAKLSTGDRAVIDAAMVYFKGDCVGGNSGGPLFDSDGNVVAILVSTNSKPGANFSDNNVCIGTRGVFFVGQ